MKTRTLTIILALFFLGGIVGCMNQFPKTPEGTYAQSLTLFNDSVEAYYNQLILQPSEVKAEWKREINPFIHTAGAALDVWGDAIGTETETDRHQTYARLWRGLWVLLIKYEILIMEE